MDAPPDRDFGPQPLDGLLRGLGIENHDLVSASAVQLTHKQVQKGRRGRYITPKIRRKIQAALESVVASRTAEGEAPRRFALDELFSYPD